MLPPDVIFYWLKCTKFDFGWGSAPDPAEGTHSALPDPSLDLRGPTSNGRGMRAMERGEGRGQDGREDEGKGGEGKVRGGRGGQWRGIVTRC